MFTARAQLRVLSILSLSFLAVPAAARHGELPNRIPEAPPYVEEEARRYPPPHEHYFAESGGPQVCVRCHSRIVEEWNGSMMANAWRDPAWRAAFFLLSKLTATDGNCGVPTPPDGTQRARLNPFANEDCTTTFDLGTKRHTMSGPGGLVDGFCSRCHMPTNYIEAIRPENVRKDEPSGLLHGLVDPAFDPTSARGGPFAFATSLEANSTSGKLGIGCSFCHTMAETRDTPFHNFERADSTYVSPAGKSSRLTLPAESSELGSVPDAASKSLGFGVGAGAYRISLEALKQPERFGPLWHQPQAGTKDPYLSSVFQRDLPRQEAHLEGAIHRGNYSILFERSEMCATCHDVTNPITIKNPAGHWVGGFPIERTYSEWSQSRYADRPGNTNYNPAFKRDCQTCHMQQHYGAPGTAQTLFQNGAPIAPLSGKPALTSPERTPYFSHHFVGGNTFTPRLVGANSTPEGRAYPYPELSKYSFSSDDPESPYHNAYFENVVGKGPRTQQPRMAWDRLRNAVSVDLAAPSNSKAGRAVKLNVTVTNTGAGHDFPTGFPEGRNAWVALSAYDLASGNELPIIDSFWKRSSLGVGYLTDHDMVDPNFPGCNWAVPAGGPDPYAWQFRAVASLGDGCPTLALPYATPLNLVVNQNGLPTDARGVVIDRSNPLGIPRFEDRDGDGDLFDDSFLLDNRLRPLPNAGAEVVLDRYSVDVPPDAKGPIAIVSAVYYQSFEAVVAKKLLGNIADSDGDHVLEPCVLRGPCDGRVPDVEPAVVEGAPPVPVAVKNAIVNIDGQADHVLPAFSFYPPEHARNVPADAVIKVTASEPVRGIDPSTFQLRDASGNAIPAAVAQISDFTWALFPNQIFLEPGQTYDVRLSGPICDFNANCADPQRSWTFSVAATVDAESADTRPPPRPVPNQEPEGEAPTAQVASMLPGGAATLLALSALGAFSFAIALAVLGRKSRAEY